MKSADFLDAVRERHGLTSDNQAAKLMGLPQSRVSKYRTGRMEFGEETAQVIATALDTDVGWIMAELAAERAKSTPAKLAWRRLAELARHSSPVVAAFLAVGVIASTAHQEAVQAGFCILRQIGRLARRTAVWGLLARPHGPQRDCKHRRRKPVLNRPGIWQCLDCGRTGCYPVRIEWTKSRTVSRFLSFPAHGRKIGRMRSPYRHFLAVGLITVLPIFAGCAGVSGEFLFGKKVSDGGFYGAGPTATLRVRKRLTGNAFCEFEHVSHVVADGIDEDTLNQVGCGFRFGGE